MRGLPAYKLTAITDGHSITSEMMQGAYSNVMKTHGLNDLADISGMKNFRSVLKEVN